jgi:hypothetical protein
MAATVAGASAAGCATKMGFRAPRMSRLGKPTSLSPVNVPDTIMNRSLSSGLMAEAGKGALLPFPWVVVGR